MKRVFIGVGHGGVDGGASANGFREADINLAMALELKSELERAGIDVAISRLTDENDPLSEEISEANNFAPDLAIDVHNNAGGGNGFEVFRQTNEFEAVSTQLAKNIEAEVLSIGQNSRGVKTKINSDGKDWFGFLRQVKAPAVLVEGGFLDNKADLSQIDTLAEQKKFGQAYAKAILKSLEVESDKLIEEDVTADKLIEEPVASPVAKKTVATATSGVFIACEKPSEVIKILSENGFDVK